MKLSLVPDLRCPRCQASPLVAHEFESTDGRCRSGVLACTACPAWYPISDYILELLPEESEEPGRRADFFRRHRSELRSLGLEAPALQGEATDHLLSPQAKQREHFDDLASRDDEFTYRTALGLTPFWQVLRDRTFSEWEPIVRPGSRVLDVGCADGLSTFPMARTGAEVLAFDISRESILQARAQAEAEGLDNVTFFVADADAIPFRDEVVDGVLCFGSLHHVPSPARTLAAAARVLREGGFYIGVENNKTPLRPIFDLAMRLRPLWKEEAGAEAHIGQADLERWTAGTPLHLVSRPTVFVPPHLCNWIGVPAASRLLRWTDAVLGRIPLIRRWGGLIRILGQKQLSAAPADGVLSPQGEPSQPALQ